MNLRTRMTSAAGVVLLGLSLGACGGATAESESPASPASTTSGSPSRSDADAQFARLMTVHHEGAIEMAELAATTAQSEEVRVLAAGIAAAQGPEIAEMDSWMQAWGERHTDDMDMEDMGMSGSDLDHMDLDDMMMNGMDQQATMDELRGLSGDEFDRRFLEQMIAHHEGAIQMATSELTDGMHAEAMTLARQIVDAQTAEIEQMKAMMSTR